MIPSDFIVTHAPMHLRLEIRKKCNFFWLRDIRDVDIMVRQSPRAKAYYLCGLSDGFVWELNTHVAFVPDSNSEVHIENDRIKLDITNARRIHFWDYVPNPPGVYTKSQRTCRNWIFANYLKDGMPL